MPRKRDTTPLTQDELIARRRNSIKREVGKLSTALIVEAMKDAPVRSGIYFLIKDRQIVYVGQSKNMLARLGNHAANGVDFDSYTTVDCDEEFLDEAESMFIRKMTPKYNLNRKNEPPISKIVEKIYNSRKPDLQPIDYKDQSETAL